MIRVAVAAAIVAVAGGAAAVLSRRQRAAGAVVSRYPSFVDPGRVGLPDGGIVVFVDPACGSCAGVIEVVAATGLAAAIVDVTIDTWPGVGDVPATVEIGADGVVRRGWIGPLPPGALTP
jgi:hypothetical protein